MTQSIGISIEIIKAYLDKAKVPEWVRIVKVSEEAGEVIDAYIVWTENNPMKADNPGSQQKVVDEFADVALAAMVGMRSLLGSVQEADRALAQRAYLKASQMQERIG